MTAALIIITLAVIFMLFCYICFRLTCVRGKQIDLTDGQIPNTNPAFAYSGRIKASGEWLKNTETVPFCIRSYDNLKLSAKLIPTKGSKRVAIMFHGYRSSAGSDFGVALDFYRSLGFNLLLVDQRCHSQSEGRYITYGIREKFDCRDWINEMIKYFGDDVEIALCGLSMGSSTVLMASGLTLPENVRCIVADCGFTSPWDIVRNTAKVNYRFVPGFILYIVNFCCRLFANFDLRDDNTLNAMQKTVTPTLFIHGTRDGFVPCEMSLRNYGTCRAEKELLTVPGASHGMSFLVAEELYKETVTAFINKYIK